MNIEANVLNEIMSTIGSVSPETGGIIGTQNDVVCAYYFEEPGVAIAIHTNRIRLL